MDLRSARLPMMAEIPGNRGHGQGGTWASPDQVVAVSRQRLSEAYRQDDRVHASIRDETRFSIERNVQT